MRWPWQSRLQGEEVTNLSLVAWNSENDLLTCLEITGNGKDGKTIHLIFNFPKDMAKWTKVEGRQR